MQKFLYKARVVVDHYVAMGVANATNYILQRLSGRPMLVARIRSHNGPIHLRNDPYDTQIFTQIFVRGELDIPLQCAPSVIIDGGANIGLATLFFKLQYPDATVIAIEPEAANFEILLLNTNALGGVKCIKKAIWNETCRVQLIDNGDGNASFVVKEYDDSDLPQSLVEAITINDIVDNFEISRINLLKLDIEGSEKEVFEKNFAMWLNRTDNVIVEIHPHLRSDCEKTVIAAFGSEFARSQSGEYSVFSRLEY